MNWHPKYRIDSLMNSWWFSLDILVLYMHHVIIFIYIFFSYIDGVMVSVFASSVVDRESEAPSGQTKDYEIGICCYFAKHAALRRKSKDWLAQNQDNVSDWGDMSIHGLLLQWASTIKIQLIVLVLCKVDLIIISLKINLFSPWYSWKLLSWH